MFGFDVTIAWESWSFSFLFSSLPPPSALGLAACFCSRVKSHDHSNLPGVSLKSPHGPSRTEFYPPNSSWHRDSFQLRISISSRAHIVNSRSVSCNHLDMPQLLQGPFLPMTLRFEDYTLIIIFYSFSHFRNSLLHSIKGINKKSFSKKSPYLASIMTW